MARLLGPDFAGRLEPATERPPIAMLAMATVAASFAPPNVATDHPDDAAVVDRAVFAV
ncbi:MAG: hypothetical protein NVSMB25_14790 [Thermoleophilaceae bacterium]